MPYRDLGETPHALDATTPRSGPPTGWFRWDPSTDHWTWSDAVFRIHGYPVASVVPSTALLLRHIADADQASAVTALLEQARTGPVEFSLRHLLLDATGRTRTVVMAGRSAVAADGPGAVGAVGAADEVGGADEDAAVLQARGPVVSGQLVDLTDLERRAGDAAVAASARSRAAIHQAQGALIALRGLSPESAQSLLVWHSQQHNVKLARLAAAVVERLSGSPGTDRVELDRLLVDVCRDLTAPTSDAKG